MKKERVKKRIKRRSKPPVNRRVAQLMVEIIDETKPLVQEIEKMNSIENYHLMKLIVIEAQACLSQLIQIEK